MLNSIAGALCNLFLRIALLFAAYQAGSLQRDTRYLKKKAETIEKANAERLKILTDSKHRDNVRKLFDTDKR
jgi:hypothetical protein